LHQGFRRSSANFARNFWTLGETTKRQ
jgi:hypothetical protein